MYKFEKAGPSDKIRNIETCPFFQHVVDYTYHNYVGVSNLTGKIITIDLPPVAYIRMS